MMKTRQIICISVMCALLLGPLNSVQAKPNSHKRAVSHFAGLSKAQLNSAYRRLLLSQASGRISGKKYRLKSRSRRGAVTLRRQAVNTAKKQLRKKYRFGGASPRRGFDCSGLMQYAYKTAHITLPRTAAQQYRHTRRVSFSRLQAGDLIFFHTHRRNRSRINHVGIYLGSGRFIHAPRTGKRVSISKLDSYWRRRVVGAGRV